MKKPRKVKKLQRKLLQLFIEKQRLQNRILNLYDRVTVMLAKGEITYDEATGFEKSCFGINVGLIKVNRKIDNVLNCKRLNRYYKMLKKEDDHYERNCY